jgi:hypothetical protein
LGNDQSRIASGCHQALLRLQSEELIKDKAQWLAIFPSSILPYGLVTPVFGMTTAISQYDHDHQRFRRPSDGQLVPLVIQSFDDIGSLPPTTQWTRLGKPLNQIPLLQRVCYWVLSPVLEVGSGRRRVTLGTVGASLMRVAGACPLLLIAVRALARSTLTVMLCD